MTYIKNKKVASWITAIIVFASILLGARSSLMDLRQATLKVFYQGEKMDGKGIQSDLEYISDQCYNLTVVAGRYIDKEDEKIVKVLENREGLVQADTPGSKYQEKESLLVTAMTLFEALGDFSLSEKDQFYKDSFPVNVESRQLIISHSSYNEKALIFNQSLKKFPANILHWIVFVKPLELYE